jgi:hypothetical protein
MNQILSLRSVGLATSGFLAFSFVLWSAGDLIMPAHEMHSAWQRLLPGRMHQLGRVLLGLVESYACGWYFRAHLGAALQH